MNKALEQEMAALRGFKISELKELLSAQTLFNIGISQVALQGMRASCPILNSSDFVRLTIGRYGEGDSELTRSS